jgi:hypothetical protein
VTDFALPEGWRDRDDAHELRLAVARMAIAEAGRLRAEERLRVSAPHDDHWEAAYGFGDAAIELIAAIQAETILRDRAAGEVAEIVARWQGG